MHLPARIVTGDDLSDDPDGIQQKLDGSRILIATPQRLQVTLATYDKLVALGWTPWWIGTSPSRTAPNARDAERVLMSRVK